MDVLAMLKRHEGLRLKPYKDSRGFSTIGYGTCLDTRGITEEEAEMLLRNEVKKNIEDLNAAMPFFDDLGEARQAVLVDMCYNLGIAGLLKFKNTLAYIAQGDYDSAAEGMLQSAWAGQVGHRATELAEIMRNGE